MVLIICALGVCLIASMALNFKLIDELERTGKQLEEMKENRMW